MGKESLDDLLTRLVEARHAEYPDDVERDAARLTALEGVLQTTLEKLRDAEAAVRRQRRWWVR